MNDPKRLDTVRLQKLSRAFVESAALFAAIDLGLFTSIDSGNNTPRKFASDAGISALNAERLMTMAAASDLINWMGDHYENAEDVQRFLVKDSERYAGPWLTFLRPGWKNWGQLTEKLKSQVSPALIGTYDRIRFLTGKTGLMGPSIRPTQ